MLNTIKSDFYKMKERKDFWIFLALCFILAVIIIFGVNIGMTRAQKYPITERLNEFVEIIPNLSGIFTLGQLLAQGVHLILIGIFIAIFLSAEFSHGTIKNTLSRGAGRVNVFISKFLVCSCAALAMQFTFMVTSLIFGTIVWGFDPQGVATFSGILNMVLIQSLLTLAFTALFTFITMTIRASGGAVATNILCVTLLPVILDATSVLIFGDTINLNGYWLGGTVTKLGTLAPASGDIVQGIILAIFWGSISIIIGVSLFQKRDVK